MMLFEQCDNILERVCLIALCVHMDEWDAVPFDKTEQVIMVGNHTGDVYLQLATAPAMKQVVQAMILPADQDYDAPLSRRIADAPVHVKFARQVGKLRMKLD